MPIQSTTPAEAHATCIDAPPAPAIDVAVLSVGKPDGIYYAGKQLAPWLTFEERLELGRFEPGYARPTERYLDLRKRRAGESVVVRWEVEGGQAGSPVVLVDRRETSASRTAEPMPQAYIWGAGARHTDCYRLGHDLLADVLSDGGTQSYRRSSNDYIDAMMRLIPDQAEPAEEWLIPERVIWRLILEEDLRRRQRDIARLHEEAMGLGIDLGSVS